MLKKLRQSIKGASAPISRWFSRVDDGPGWRPISARGHERGWEEIQELYIDGLTAWRKNPLAWRVIATTTDYVIGNGMRLRSPNPHLDAFIQRFWYHRLNRMDVRLPALADELWRAGDLFILLFRNPLDGMSYLRLVTKDRIQQVETAENDWEQEQAYLEQATDGLSPRRWLAAEAPESRAAPAVMLHYAINRPVGALLGESDLSTMIPWLLRYSRMLEDRVRLHWSARAFLYLVTVPSTRVEAKASQYATPPETGSIVVKDESETWETVTPALRGADSAHDLKAVRGMIDAGSGFPPHWRGEGSDVNRATAEAMQAPAERHLARRQQYFAFILQDILYQAYQRAVQADLAPALDTDDYQALFTVEMTEISRTDNLTLASAAREMAQAMRTLTQMLPERSPTLERLVTRLVLKFAGEPQAEEVIQQVAGQPPRFHHPKKDTAAG